MNHLVSAFAALAGFPLSSAPVYSAEPVKNIVLVHGASDGFRTLDPKTFHEDFAADLPEADADFMARSQVPVSEKALGTKVTEAAWRSKPSWYVVATEDHKINPDFERYMAKRAGSSTVEIKGSHAVYVSQPQAVADLIKDAAEGAASN
ncbi:alpha/beta hydrolase [Rhizobium sp. NZLR10]|uniref:alpha/beta hydrolase n=1 Tax=Rhizobium sp. NZLR10 TaxID=2731097 RepID=UPI001C838BCF|nr:alpha/beta hydrolase [Rhizobium sp. NZLR10]